MSAAVVMEPGFPLPIQQRLNVLPSIIRAVLRGRPILYCCQVYAGVGMDCVGIPSGTQGGVVAGVECHGQGTAAFALELP